MINKEPFAVRALKKVFHSPTNFPYFVQLAITDACNLNCEMCPRHYVSVTPKHMDFEIFKKIVDRLNGVEQISLVGLGEPFVYPKIFEAIQYCRSNGMMVNVTTNGLMLNSEKKLRKLVSSGLNAISFSIESIDEYKMDSKVHQNYDVLSFITRLLEIKKELGADNPKVVVQSVLVKNKEKDIYDIIKWCARNNIDRVNILRMTKYFETGLERPNMEEEKKVFKEISRLRKKYKIRIDCMQDQFYSGIKGFLYKYSKNFLGLDSFCVRLLDYPYITREGDMIPCCVLPDFKFGNVLEKDIRDIWLGEKLNHFRKSHNSIEICSKCDNLRIKQLV